MPIERESLKIHSLLTEPRPVSGGAWHSRALEEDSYPYATGSAEDEIRGSQQLFLERHCSRIFSANTSELLQMAWHCQISTLVCKITYN